MIAGVDVRHRILFSTVAGITVALAFATPRAEAEPYLAVRTGFKCSQCHVNRSGGGKRTDFGVLYSQTNLPLMLLPVPGESGLVSPKFADRFSVGANLRADSLTRFDGQDAAGATLPAIHDASLSRLSVYLQADLIHDRLTVYMDQVVAPNGVNRELFAMVQGLPGSSYVKAGRMLLPFGLRFVDDDLFVRSRSGYTFNRHDVGVEIGAEPGPLSLVANVTNDQLSLRAATVFRRFRVGASYGEGLSDSQSSVWGGFAGVNLGRFTLLGEGDFIHQNERDRFAALAEVNFLAARGLNFKLTYEWFEADRTLASSADQTRVSVGVEPFITQFVQLGLFYRHNVRAPAALDPRDSLLVQFHAFF